MATDLTLRNEKGETLTFSELDSNFLALDSDIVNVGNTIGNLAADYMTLATDQSVTGQKTFQGTLSADSVSTDKIILSDEADIIFNVDDHILQLEHDNVVLEMGSNWFYAKASEAISKGDVVYLSDAEFNTPIISLADASAEGFNRDRVLGLAHDDIASGDYGYVLEEGNISDLNTNSFIVGDVVYLHASTAGGLTKTKPTYPNPSIELGLVLRSDASTGRIHVRIVQEYSTDNTEEGNNLYYTTLRVDSDIDARVTKGFVDALGVNAASVDGFNGIGIYDSVGNLLNGA
jgi:hypothetical protein